MVCSQHTSSADIVLYLAIGVYVSEKIFLPSPCSILGVKTLQTTDVHWCSQPVSRRLQIKCVFGRNPGLIEYGKAQTPAKFAEDQRRRQEVQCYDVSHQTFEITVPVVIS